VDILRRHFLLLFFLLWTGWGEASTNFGLFLDAPAYDKMVYKSLNDYLNKIDGQIQDGIRFGVDRLVTIHFDESLPALENPHCNEFDENFYARIENDQTIAINSHIREMILNNSIRQKVGECSHQSLLIRSMEKVLLKLPRTHDLEEKLSADDEENDDLVEKRKSYQKYKKKLKRFCAREKRLFSHHACSIRAIFFEYQVVLGYQCTLA
jgi:hypothetical protein